MTPHRTENGSLPPTWRSVRLGNHVTKVGSGFTPLGGQSVYLTSGVPLIRSQNVLMNRFEIEGIAYISQEQDGEMSASRVQAGDVLLNITGASIGRVCVAPAEVCPANVNQHVCIIRTDGSIIPEFLALYLATPQFQQFIANSQAGATRQALTKVMIEDFRIPLSPTNEQQRVVACLHEQLAEVARSRAAVNVQLDAVEALPVTLFRESSQNAKAVPRKLADCLIEVTDGVGGDWRKYRVLGATRDGLAPAKEPVGKHPERYKRVTPGTVFYNPMRIMIGSIAMLDDGQKCGITSPDYVVLRARERVLHPRWFFYWLRSSYGENLIKSLARGAVRERMMFKRLATGEIDLPPWGEQLKVAELLAEISPLGARLTEKLAFIDRLPTALLRGVFPLFAGDG